jgi:hypothetical protein
MITASARSGAVTRDPTCLRCSDRSPSHNGSGSPRPEPQQHTHLIIASRAMDALRAAPALQHLQVPRAVRRPPTIRPPPPVTARPISPRVPPRLDTTRARPAQRQTTGMDEHQLRRTGFLGRLLRQGEAALCARDRRARRSSNAGAQERPADAPARARAQGPHRAFHRAGLTRHAACARRLKRSLEEVGARVGAGSGVSHGDRPGPPVGYRRCGSRTRVLDVQGEASPSMVGAYRRRWVRLPLRFADRLGGAGTASRSWSAEAATGAL